MCDAFRMNEIYNELKKLQPDETLQLQLAAKDDEERGFYQMLGNFLLQEQQKKAIADNRF